MLAVWYRLFCMKGRREASGNRLSIARNTEWRSHVALADETGRTDAATRRAEVAANRAKPEIFSLATHVAMLHHGVIMAPGDPAEFQACPELAVQQFLHGQTEGPIVVK